MGVDSESDFDLNEPGFKTIRISDWADFNHCIRVLGRWQSFVWRGQSSADWKLLPALDRQNRQISEHERKVHLKRFTSACRGRRSPRFVSSRGHSSSVTEWWAIGQHYGLLTPLLDWTRSPYVAAYFAFGALEEQPEYRAVFGLHQDSVQRKSQLLPPSQAVNFVNPLAGDNARLLSQGGLFTWAPAGVALEDWVRQHFTNDLEHFKLLKIIIPNDEREVGLQTLNRMNINHLSLYPDLYGAAEFTNLHLSIPDY